MAKLQLYQSQGGPGYTGGASYSGLAGMASNLGNPNVEALDYTARTVANVGGQVTADQAQADAARAKAAEDSAAIDASARVMAARRHWAEDLPRRQASAIETGKIDDFADSTIADYDKYVETEVGQAKSPAAGAWMREHLGALQLEIGDSSRAFQAGAVADRDVRLVGQALDDARVVVDLQPGAYDGSREALKLQYARLPADKRAKLFDDADQDLAYSAGVGAVRKDPYSVVKALNAKVGTSGVPYVDNLGADGRLRLRSYAETEIKQREAEADAQKTEARTVLQDRVQNHTAMSNDGVPIKDPLTQADFAAVYKPEEAALRYGEYNTVLQLGPQLAAVTRAPATDIAAIVDASDPGLPAGQRRVAGMVTPPTADAPSRPEGEAVSAIVIGTAKGSVLIPSVGPDGEPLDAADAAEQYKATGKHLGIFSSPEAADRYAAELAMPQEPADAESLGYATKAQVHDRLSQRAKDVVKQREDDPGLFMVSTSPQVAEAYRALLAASDDDAASAAANYASVAGAESQRLQNQNRSILPQSYIDSRVSAFLEPAEAVTGSPGEPAAAGIIEEQKKWGAHWPEVFAQMAPHLPAAAFVIGSGMRVEPAGRLAELSKMKDEDVAAMLPTSRSPSDVKSLINDGLAPLISSAMGQPGTAKTIAMLQDSAWRLSAYYMRSGKSLSDSVNAAVSEVGMERYTFPVMRGATVRIPRTYQPPGAAMPVELPEVEIKAGLRHAWTNDVVPMRLRNQDDAVWRTVPSDTGVALVINGVIPVREDGSQVVYTWDQLRQRTATEREALRTTDKPRNAGRIGQ